MAEWCTYADYQVLLGLPASTDDEHKLIGLAVDAANSYVTRCRPDVEPPAAWTDATGKRHVAVRDPANPDMPEGEAGAIARAAVEVCAAWVKQGGRGTSASSYAEFGYQPPIVGKDVQDLLRIGRSARSVVA